MVDSFSIVGLGPSNVAVFNDIAKQAKLFDAVFGSHGVPEKTVYLIDFDSNHGSGKAWGDQAHPSCLFDTPVGFLKDGFPEWLKQNEDIWLPQVEKHKDGALKTWFNLNEEALEDKDYGNMHFPRFVYGLFKKEQFYESLQDLPEFLNVVVLDGRVTGIDENDSKTTLVFSGKAEEVSAVKNEEGIIKIEGTGKFIERIEVGQNLIGIGSPEPNPYEKVEKNKGYFNSTYNTHPSLEPDVFHKQFKTRVVELYEEKGEKLKLGILGTGPSFLDMANIVYNDEELKDKVEITAISTSGLSRNHPDKDKVKSYPSKILTKDYKITSPQQLHADAEEELRYGMSLENPSYSTTEILRGGANLSKLIFEDLGVEDRREFLNIKSKNNVLKLMEKTTKETQEALDGLDISYVAAKVKDIKESEDRLVVEVLNKRLDDEGYIYNKSAVTDKNEFEFDITVNVLGFGKGKDVGVLKDGIEKGIFKAEGKSVATDDNMNASDKSMMNGYLVFGKGHLKNDEFPAFLNNVNAGASKFSAAIFNILFEDEEKGIAESIDFLKGAEIQKFSEPEKSNFQNMVRE